MTGLPPEASSKLLERMTQVQSNRAFMQSVVFPYMRLVPDQVGFDDFEIEYVCHTYRCAFGWYVWLRYGLHFAEWDVVKGCSFKRIGKEFDLSTYDVVYVFGTRAESPLDLDGREAHFRDAIAGGV